MVIHVNRAATLDVVAVLHQFGDLRFRDIFAGAHLLGPPADPHDCVGSLMEPEGRGQHDRERRQMQLAKHAGAGARRVIVETENGPELLGVGTHDVEVCVAEDHALRQQHPAHALPREADRSKAAMRDHVQRFGRLGEDRAVFLTDRQRAATIAG